MKIGMNEILRGIELTAIEKIKRELVKEGFVVKNDFKTSEDKFPIDLYAERGEDKRIYELKIGKNRIQKKQYAMLQAEAKRLGAKLYIVYLEVPRSKEVTFNGLDKIILEDLLDNYPFEIDGLSTHTTIESVEDVEIDTMEIASGIARITGSGSINIRLWFAPRSDIPHSKPVEDYGNVGFFFKLSISLSDNTIVKRYYKIDIEE